MVSYTFSFHNQFNNKLSLNYKVFTEIIYDLCSITNFKIILVPRILGKIQKEFNLIQVKNEFLYIFLYFFYKQSKLR